MTDAIVENVVCLSFLGLVDTEVRFPFCDAGWACH